MAERNLDFDTVIDRRGSGCLKYDFAAERGYNSDVLPLWVADMDFKTSSYIEDALHRVANHGIFGYSDTKQDYADAVASWFERRHGWKPKSEWLIKTPGVVTALAVAVQAYTAPGDSVLIQQPVYYPFSDVIKKNGRRVISNNLVRDEETGRYKIDFEDFEHKIVSEHVKLFILCNPHNPVSRVWSRNELERLGDICLKHGVIVASDEIHADFTFVGKHTVFASIKSEFAENCIVCTAPSKTFNLASMLLSNIFIPNKKLRIRFANTLESFGLSQLSIFGIEACKAAYLNGEKWFDAVKAYIAENVAFVSDFVAEHLPGVRLTPHEGTYLVWLDFSGTGLSTDELEDKIVGEAKLWLDSGRIFGKSGNGFQRINVACPRATLNEALERIRKVLYK
ncbi:MalY/PatB family protein [Treponema zioleckii]|uniref:MalY/PatB family protein n=1 Tax=Treponema zioleckii TaxID=331680 RepID=UPI00168AD8D6|nr:MalY/PatB family protein [Treponema zioleckii]